MGHRKAFKKQRLAAQSHGTGKKAGKGGKKKK
jgi:hypothetical protein